MSTPEFTKYMIAQGMKDLLRSHSFENISVGTLAEYCKISRNTFYYHFKDKYDVITWIFYSEITPMLSEFDAFEKWTDGLYRLCRYMRENKDFYIKILGVRGQNAFSECLNDFYISLTENLILKAHGDRVLSQDQIHIISHFYAYGLTCIVLEWARDGMRRDPKPDIQILEDLLSGEVVEKILALQKESERESDSAASN